MLSVHLILLVISYVASIECTNNNNSGIKTNSQRKNINNCENSWKYPQNCETTDCTYELEWRYRPHDGVIDFLVTSRPGLNHTRRWTGLGFHKVSFEGLLDKEAIFCWPEDEQNTNYLMMDATVQRWSYRQLPIKPIKNDRQNIYNASADIHNGTYSYRFTRKLGYKYNDFTFGECIYLIALVDGGPVNLHDTNPITSKYQPIITVCFRDCSYELASETFAWPPISLSPINDIEASRDADPLVAGQFNSSVQTPTSYPRSAAIDSTSNTASSVSKINMIDGSNMAGIGEVKVNSMEPLAEGKGLTELVRAESAEAVQSELRNDKMVKRDKSLESQESNQVVQGATEGTLNNLIRDSVKAIQQTARDAAASLNMLPMILATMYSSNMPAHQQQQQSKESACREWAGKGLVTRGSLFGGSNSLGGVGNVARTGNNQHQPSGGVFGGEGLQNDVPNFPKVYYDKPMPEEQWAEFMRIYERSTRIKAAERPGLYPVREISTGY